MNIVDQNEIQSVLWNQHNQGQLLWGTLTTLCLQITPIEMEAVVMAVVSVMDKLELIKAARQVHRIHISKTLLIATINIISKGIQVEVELLSGKTK